ncbi:hypothetical protein BLNAU_25130 [Blattamonas nauphoetae]|uniref:Uncharacterized protein n=1 Tax=Blattamonas nauphoetae TaxID=2049346 RepID=A0ABQ9WKU2_9EUKA|nr:hypothetical protein BLNAU_25130 [Blattamonas nauphoetae]
MRYRSVESDCTEHVSCTSTQTAEAVTFRNPIFHHPLHQRHSTEADTTSLSRPDVTHIPQGAISISYAPLTLTACTFSSNSPSNLEWPSLRRNSKCTDGTVAMDLMNEGDAPASHHLWIWTDEGVVTKEDETQHSTLFVPTLVANESTVTLDNNLKEYSVKIVGTMMIPYGLKLEVFEQDALSFERGTTTQVRHLLPPTVEMDRNRAVKPKLRCQLVNADDQATDSFLLTGLSNENITQARVIASIVVPSVVVIIVVVLVIIVIAVLFRRRKMKERQPRKTIKVEVCEAGDVRKDERNAQDNTIKPIIETARMSNNSLLTPPMMSLKHVDAVKCDGEGGVVSVDPTNSCIVF